jgi:hypothetical protein
MWKPMLLAARHRDGSGRFASAHRGAGARAATIIPICGCPTAVARLPPANLP